MKTKNLGRVCRQAGFTLVELLIVIALIAILSVAVLATINPIEQSNKAKDSSTQNDAAEVLNAYERYYANASKYPWMVFSDSASLTSDTAVFYDSKMVGFGICYGAATVASNAVGACNTSGADLGELISTDELKSSFVGKSEFQSTNNQDKLWVIKPTGSAIYVCYVPKSKSSRQLTDKLYCINSATDTIVKVESSASDACVALDVSSTSWSTPDFTGVNGMYRCVPE